MKVAVIQPYFIPYPGYFRLFAEADIVVMFDCVQFPRRGWLHRNRLPLRDGRQGWVKLPIAHAPVDTLIRDLIFRPNAYVELEAQFMRFGLTRQTDLVDRVLAGCDGPVSEYLIDLLDVFLRRLGLTKPMIRSTALQIPPNLRGQARVIAICKALGATHYVNPSGGRDLYDGASFASAGMTLGFLKPYEGGYASILSRLLNDSPQSVRAEILKETVVEWMS